MEDISHRFICHQYCFGSFQVQARILRHYLRPRASCDVAWMWRHSLSFFTVLWRIRTIRFIMWFGWNLPDLNENGVYNIRTIILLSAFSCHVSSAHLYNIQCYTSALLLQKFVISLSVLCMRITVQNLLRRKIVSFRLN